MEQLLKNKVALITGGSRGIGAETARLFAREGASVVVTARGEEALAELCGEICDAGGTADYFAADAADPGACKDILSFVLETFERIDILVCNAGMALRTPTLDVTPEEWERVMRVNLTTPAELSRLCLREFVKQKSGKLVYVSSTAGKSVNLGASASYGASKSGLLYLTRHFGLEFAGDNIQVNAVCPGPVETEITKTWTPEHWARVQANLPMGHMAKPLDIANAILFLASPLSDHMTGESILVNGGKFMD